MKKNAKQRLNRANEKVNQLLTDLDLFIWVIAVVVNGLSTPTERK
jgi:hypothetical protein